MKLVILYGPPAVGKLSVSEALAAETGFRVLHNHLFIDLAEAVYGERTQAMAAFTRQLRELSLGAAREARVLGIILTYVYARDRDAYILGLCERVEAAGDEVCLVQLTASLATLEARVTEPSRRAFGKLMTVEGLHETLGRLNEPHATFEEREGLRIVTDDKTPAEVAAGIVQHW